MKRTFFRHFRGSFTNVVRFRILHVSIKRKLENPSVHGHIHVLTIVEEDRGLLAICYICGKADDATEVLRLIIYFVKETAHAAYKIHTDEIAVFWRALNQLEREGLEISVPAVHTPCSKSFDKHAHQTVIKLQRICPKKSESPVQYWSYAVQHVADCKKAKPGKKEKILYEVLFNRLSPSIKHVRPSVVTCCDTYFERRLTHLSLVQSTSSACIMKVVVSIATLRWTIFWRRNI